jgi:phage terminase large subunit-like protein
MTLPNWTTARPDWEERIQQGRSLLPCGPLFPDEAAASMRVFRALRIVDLKGRPTFGECSRTWVLDFTEMFFGSYNPEDGHRYISNYMLLVAKKNTKSTIAAGIMLTALIRNWRDSAEYLILAPTIEIANNSFKPARDMVRADQRLNDLLQVQEHYRTITHRTTGASLKVVAADAGTVGGKKATGILVDELWQFGAIHNAGDMLLEAEGGLQSRPEGFVIYISTHSSEPSAGVFGQKLRYFRDVRDGKTVDKASIGVLYEFPPSMLADKSYLDPANWYITNPNLGASARKEYIQRKLDEAAEAGEESIRVTRAKLLNVPVTMSMRGDRWTGADFWEGCGDKNLRSLDALLERCDVVTSGIDGGGLDDLLGLCVLGREKETRRWLAWFHAWAHEIVLERRKEIAPKLRDFEREGTLTIVANDSSDDIRGVADIVEKIAEAGLLPSAKGIGVDPAGVADIVDELERRGFTTDDETGAITAIRQGFWTLNNTTKATERRLAARTLVHGGSAMMTWCVANAKLVPHGNAVTIEKQASGTAKIDPLMALFNAVALMALNPAAAPKGRLDDFLTSHLAA